MKNKSLLRLLIIVFATAMVFTLFACAETDTSTEPSADKPSTGEGVLSIELNEASVTKFRLGEEMDISKILINVYYSDGTKDTINANDEMISAEDRLKFKTEGAKTIVLLYGGAKVACPITIETVAQETLYTVTFDSNGGSYVAPVKTNLLTSITSPTRDGYIFVGWYDNINLTGIAFKPTKTITKDMTYYAKWQDNRWWKVTFLDRLGNPIAASEQSIENGKNVESFPEPPVEEGYTFVEWRGQSTNIDKDISITAIYEIISCTIYYYYDYGTSNEQVIERPLYYGDAFTSTVNFPAKEGFNGEWMLLGANGETVDIGDAFDRVTSDLKIVPVYTPIQYLVTFYDDPLYRSGTDGWRSVTKTVTYGTDINLSLQQFADLDLTREGKYRVGNTATWSIQTKVKPEDSAKIIRNIDARSTDQWDELIQEWKTITGEMTSTYNVYNDANEVVAVIDNGVITKIKAPLTITARYVKKKYSLEFHYYKNEQSYYATKKYENVKYGTKFSLYAIAGEDRLPDVMYGEEGKSAYTQYPYLEDWDVKWYPSSSYSADEEIIFDDGAYITVDESSSGTHLFWGVGTDLRKYQVRFYDYNILTGQHELMPEYTQEVSKGRSPNIPVISDLVGKQGYALVSNNNDSWRDRPMGSEYYVTTANNYSVTHDIDFYAWYVKKSWTMSFRDYKYTYTDEAGSLLNTFVPSLDIGSTVTTQGDTRVCTMSVSYVRENGYKFNLPKELYFGGDAIYKIVSFIETYLADDVTIGSDLPGCTSGLNHGYATETEAAQVLNSVKYMFAQELITMDGSPNIAITPRSNGKYYPIDYIAKAYDRATALRQAIEAFRLNALTYENEGEDKADERALYAKVGDRYYEILDGQYHALQLLRSVVSHYDTATARTYGFLLSDNNRLSAGEIESLVNNSNGKTYADYMSKYQAATGKTYEENGGFASLKYYTESGEDNYIVTSRQEGRYSFSEWFSSARYATDAIMTGEGGVFVNADQLNRGLENNIVLYAKWTDMFYGTAGLIFKLIEDGEELYHYELVDYTHDEYIKILTVQDKTDPISLLNALAEWNGDDADDSRWYVKKLGDEFFTMKYIKNGVIVEDTGLYSVNIPEGTGIPSSSDILEESIINIPATHGSITVSVTKGDIFSRLDYEMISAITQVNLPQSLTLIEEGSFSALSALSGILFKEGEGADTGEPGGVEVTNSRYVVVDNVLYEKEGSVLVVLLQYCAGIERKDISVIVDGTSVSQDANIFVVPSTVRRIANGAFSSIPESYIDSMSRLPVIFATKIGFADGTVDIVIGKEAFARSHIETVGRAIVSNGKYEVSSTLPDRVTVIEDSAFAFSTLMTVSAEAATSKLTDVGKDAFYMSMWYYVCNNSRTSMILGRVFVKYFPEENAPDVSMLYLGVAGQSFVGIDTANIIAVADYAFYDVDNVVKIDNLILGEGFVHIGEGAFQDCSLQSVDASAVTSANACVVEDMAFTGGTTGFRVKCGLGRQSEFETATTGWNKYTLTE